MEENISEYNIMALPKLMRHNLHGKPSYAAFYKWKKHKRISKGFLKIYL